jgi:hypothetical protein
VLSCQIRTRNVLARREVVLSSLRVLLDLAQVVTLTTIIHSNEPDWFVVRGKLLYTCVSLVRKRRASTFAEWCVGNDRPKFGWRNWSADMAALSVFVSAIGTFFWKYATGHTGGWLAPCCVVGKSVPSFDAPHLARQVQQ